MKPAEHPLSALLPNTDYYELDSQVSGNRYGVWVAYPAGAKNAKQTYPVVFVPDGNSSASILIPMSPFVNADPINSVKPVIIVAVGYTGDDAADQWLIRARDLIPPGEPVDPIQESDLDRDVSAGVCTQEYADRYRLLLHNGRGDHFLAVLFDELLPAIANRYSVDSTDCGLFGYSLGGLFATYAALQGIHLIKRVGAGSPAIISSESVVFRALASHQALKASLPLSHLHMTICERELTTSSVFQRFARNYSRFVAEWGSRPLANVKLTARVIPEESHATGTWPSWYSFLRACYGRNSSAG